MKLYRYTETLWQYVYFEAESMEEARKMYESEELDPYDWDVQDTLATEFDNEYEEVVPDFVSE